MTLPFRWFAVAAAIIGLPSAAMSQHHHHHERSGGYIVRPQHHDHVLVDPGGHLVVEHHENYQYVVPAVTAAHGTYYTHENTRYYTPPAQIVRGQTAYAQPTQIAFGGFSQVEDLGGRIERAANEICHDLHYNYQHNPGFREAYREAYALFQQAKALHAADHHQDQAQVVGLVQQLDGLAHHVSAEVLHFQPHVTRPIGPYDLHDKFAQLESMIHHLMHDVGIEPHAEGGEQAPPPGLEDAPPPVGFNGPPGFSPPGNFGSAPGDPAFSGRVGTAANSPPGQTGVFLDIAPPQTVPPSQP